MTGQIMATDSFQTFEKMPHQASMTKKWTRCDMDHCGRPAIGSLELKYFCLDHFISYCYKRLDQCCGMPYADSDDTRSAPDERFLRECIELAADWVRPTRGLDNLDRARLFDIFLWASELTTKRELLKPPKMVKADAAR
jgi:hypothetical protein